MLSVCVQSEQCHDAAMRRELRRLREEDMVQVQQRKRRLEITRKHKIMEKERASDDTLRVLKFHESYLK